MRVILLFIAGVLLSGCVASPRFTSEKINKSEEFSGEFISEGIASYYADEYHGRKTSNGEKYDMYALTAAHQQLPFNTKVKVTNLNNGKSVSVRINDRGPFKDSRIIDLSYTAAKELGMIGPGTASVRLDIIELGNQK
ncbi:MAG: septal ring lytic transglycosylase RlpA family lipoprotein [Chlorobiaceae bacterium]|nr:septal ring lytic transglycosylase RlpA family lipoprotein [Chlorobiaceae bacterium]